MSNQDLQRPDTLPEHLIPIWNETVGRVKRQIGSIGLEALCGQVYRMRKAQESVTNDGAVVADAKGNPCAHPALAIERQAQAEILKWISKYGTR